MLKKHNKRICVCVGGQGISKGRKQGEREGEREEKRNNSPKLN